MKEYTQRQIKDELRTIALMTINERQIASDALINFTCHRAYQEMIGNLDGVYNSIVNSLTDEILSKLVRESLVKRVPGSTGEPNAFSEDYYFITIKGAWLLYNDFHAKKVDIQLYGRSSEYAHKEYGMDDSKTLHMIDVEYGPFLTIDIYRRW